LNSFKKQTTVNDDFFAVPTKAEVKKRENIISFNDMNISKPLIKVT
jgi:hypothetical protein